MKTKRKRPTVRDIVMERLKQAIIHLGHALVYSFDLKQVDAEMVKFAQVLLVELGALTQQLQELSTKGKE